MKFMYAIANDSGCYGIGDVVQIVSFRLDGNDIIAKDIWGDEFTCYDSIFETETGIKPVDTNRYLTLAPECKCHEST